MAPTTSLSLMYFDFEGPALPVRLALAMTGQPWEDKRLTFDQFQAVKLVLPNGQLPVLVVNGEMLPQSHAQLRYACKLAGLYPTDPLEAAFADAAVDTVVDNHRVLAPTIQEKDAAKQVEMRKDMMETFLPMWLGNLEKALKAAGGKYFAGGKLSIGDIAVVARLMWLKDGTLDGIPTTILDDYPLLSSLIVRVIGEPKIATYLQERAV